MSSSLQILGFIHKKVWSEHHTITDNINLSALKYSRRNTPQHIFFTFKFKRMTGIGTTLKTCNNIIFRGKHVYNFAFAFITPLQT